MTYRVVVSQVTPLTLRQLDEHFAEHTPVGRRLLAEPVVSATWWVERADALRYGDVLIHQRPVTDGRYRVRVVEVPDGARAWRAGEQVACMVADLRGGWAL